MDELAAMDAEISALAEAQRSGQAERPLPAEFYIEPKLDETKSKEAGRPVYSDVEMVRIRVGRDFLEHPITAEDKRTYAAQYLAWRKGETQESVEGMPLSEWAAMPSRSIVKEFAYMGIRSVEQLAATNDSTLALVGPHLQLREKARVWLADAEKKAPLMKIHAENAELRSRLATLEDMLQRQGKEIELARTQGGSLATQAAPDPRLSALEAQLAKLAEAVSAQRVNGVDVAEPVKRRGRPPGSKNKPKTGEEN